MKHRFVLKELQKLIINIRNFSDSVMQEFHVPVIDMIDGANYRRIIAVAQVVDIQRRLI